MTHAKLEQDEWLRWIKVNGRKVFVNRITEIEQISKARWQGIAGGTRFEIEGGRQSGGTSRQWFMTWDTLGFTMNATSMTDAIRLIENA